MSVVSLFHGSSTPGIARLEPRLGTTPGQEEESPAGIYASDDPAFAAAHSFPWVSSDGIDLYYERDEGREWVVLEVPKRHADRLQVPVYLYKVASIRFTLLNIPPFGHNFRSEQSVDCLEMLAYSSVTEAVEKSGGELKIIE